MTLRTLKDKFHFYLKMYSKSVGSIEFSDAEEFELLMEGLSRVMKELGKFNDSSYTPTSNTPAKTVTLPQDFGWIRRVYYDGELIADSNYKIGYQGTSFYLEFDDNIIPSSLKIDYYTLPLQMLTLWGVGAATSRYAVATHTFTDNYVIPLPEFFTMAIVYGAIALIIPQVEPLFAKEISLIRSVLEKPDAIEKRDYSNWRI